MDPEFQKEQKRQLRSLRRQGMGVVALATQAVPLPSVKVDNEAMGYIAAQYLIECGHRRIAFIAGPEQICTSHERLQGYKMALAGAGIPEDPALVVWGDFSREEGYRLTLELLARGTSFSAICASNDEMAIGARSALREQGFCVPEDVSLMGMDDIKPAKFVDPPLTTVAVPMHEMGVRAMDLAGVYVV